MPNEVIWTPGEARMRDAQIRRYTDWLARQHGLRFADYEALWRWSVTDLAGFWQSIWNYFDLQSPTSIGRVLDAAKMPGARWFAGAQVNFAQQVFRHRTEARPAIVASNERGEWQEVGWAELEQQVGALAAKLRELGVQPGDRVVAYLPNVPQTVVAFLAVVSIGAIWSVCSPDMGPVSVLDRFRQIEPKVLIATDAYQYGGKVHDRSEVVGELLRSLSTVETFVHVPIVAARTITYPNVVDWADLVAGQAPLAPLWLPFDAPLWVVYSSGTTGMPKPIVHGHGGILVEALKMTVLHNNVSAGDRFHWYTSTGWIMWNCQVFALLAGTTILLYDGNPGWPDMGVLWRFVGQAKATVFGAGAAFFASCLKASVVPRREADLGHLRTIGSTGSPLSDDAYRWIYAELGPDIWLAPISGGTDLSGPFIGGNVTMPIVVGEMQCRCLGANVQAFDEAGKALMDEVGELVCTTPMPSMPLYFWNDPTGQRFHESYFDMYPGVWRHGDWIRITPRGGAIIYGRSDATINRHGIRMGTAELYRAVEALPEVLDSIVVDLEYLGRESYMPLFVVLREGVALTDELVARMKTEIRQALSPRHVPNDVFVIPAVPRTLSGKKLEVPIKRMLLGHAVDKVLNVDSMANPDSLPWFIAFAERYLHERR